MSLSPASALASREEILDEFIAEGQPKRWPMVLRQMCDVLDATFKTAIPDASLRWETCAKAVIGISQQCGGCDVYIPRGDTLERQLRDHRIWVLMAEQGVSEHAISTNYVISERHVRRIIEEQRALRVTRVQGQLFPA
jgi:Mor family transcriptional regulator